MNYFFGFCWAASYFMIFISFIVYGWRWADEIKTAEAMAFWLLLTAVFLLLGLYLLRSIKDNV